MDKEAEMVWEVETFWIPSNLTEGAIARVTIKPWVVQDFSGFSTEIAMFHKSPSSRQMGWMIISMTSCCP